MDFSYYIEEFVLTVMDALEELLNTITVPVGKKIYSVFGVLIAFFVFSLLCLLFDLPTFVSWIEALVACGIMGVIILFNVISKSSIEEAKNKFMKVGGKRNGK